MKYLSLLGAALLVALCVPVADAAIPLGPPDGQLALPGRAHGLQIVGTKAYVALENGLAIVDLQNPLAPTLLGKVPPLTKWKSEAVAVKGTIAYLASPVSGLIVVNVQNPAAPFVVTNRYVYAGLGDVAIKGDVVYGVSGAGEMYVFDIAGTKATTPVQHKVIGLPAWGLPGGDKVNLQRLQSGATSGNGRGTGVTVAGPLVLAVEWGYGRVYAWDASDALNPVFAGTHYAPYTLKVVADFDGDVIYMLSAYGTASGIYTVPISKLDPSISTRHATCAECGFLKSLQGVDMGGLAAVPGFNHLVWAGGKGAGEAHVVSVDPSTTPPTMVDEVNGPIGSHAVAMASAMGVGALGDYVVITAGILGMRVYHVPGLAP
jgi:hypothetical protein